MRIALISFEFPPETAYGGIASYKHETALMLARGGHDVEVFCAGETALETMIEPGIRVHTIAGLDKDRFAELVLPIFAHRHSALRFEVAECAEIYGDGRAVRRAFPDLPLLVKLHTPSFLCARLNHVPLTFAAKLRFFAGSVRRGKPNWLKPNLTVLEIRNRTESALYRAADAVVSPSRDLIGLIEAEWGPRPDGIGHLPNPHFASPDLLRIAPPAHDAPLLYLGRLELRKGVTDLIEALSILEKSRYLIRATFVGACFPSPVPTLAMDKWAALRLDTHSGRYRFTGMLPRPAITSELAACNLVVLPSRWENFPYTCLEAMAAGRPIIASAAGGMRDMITDGVDGFLVPPHSPRMLVAKIRECLAQPARLVAIGEAARRRVLAAYSPSAILPQQLAAYQRAIDANQARHRPIPE